jgi:hypothetical protein
VVKKDGNSKVSAGGIVRVALKNGGNVVIVAIESMFINNREF